MIWWFIAGAAGVLAGVVGTLFVLWRIFYKGMEGSG